MAIARVALPADVRICFFFQFYFMAIAKAVIALNVVRLKRWKQELLDELFCLAHWCLKAGIFFKSTTLVC